MLKSETSQSSTGMAVRTRIRNSTSCTECKRRKQKCNQAKDKSCNNCARRYPPVPCVYETKRKPSKSSGTLIELDGANSKGKAEDGSEYALPNKLNLYRGTDKSTKVHTSNSFSLSTSTWSEERDLESERTSHDRTNRNNTTAEQKHGVDHVDVRFADSRSAYFPPPELSENSSFAIIAKSFRNPTLEPLYNLPIEPSRRNAELYHMFIHRLSPYMTSIDGQDPSTAFNDEYIPFMLQSPLNVYIPLLTTSYFKALSEGVTVDKSVECIATRVKIINLINKYLSKENITDEVLAVVMSVSYNELVYSDERSVMAHMRGLGSMMRARGGIDTVKPRFLRKLLLRTDYQVASTFERNPLIDKEFNAEIPIFENYPAQVDNPLLRSRVNFVESTEALGISARTAQILDDMRFLTTTILTFKDKPISDIETTKFQATAQWIHNHLTAPIGPSLATDFIYQTCRTTAIMYSEAILSRTPLSRSGSRQLLAQLWGAQWRVPLARWKKIPGIFFWIVLTSAPFSRDKPEGRWQKGMVSCATIAIGLVDWEVVMGMLRAFLAVQRWLEGGTEENSVLSTENIPEMAKSV